MIALFVRGNDANTELLRYLANSELCIGFSSNEKSSDIFSIIPQSSIDNFLKRLIVLRLSYKALYDNLKTISLFKKLSIELCGIIENMSEDFSLDEKPIHNSELAKYLSSSVLASLPLTKRAIIHEETLKLNRLEKYFSKELLKL